MNEITVFLEGNEKDNKDVVSLVKANFSKELLKEGHAMYKDYITIQAPLSEVRHVLDSNDNLLYSWNSYYKYIVAMGIARV